MFHNFSTISSFSGQWKLHGLNCYQFFSIRHSWQKASELCKRYGSNLVSVASFRQNNFTGELAQQQLQTSNPEEAYWLGYQTQNELQTNTLASASGSQISQYYGHWAQEQPDTGDGRCVEALLPEDPRRQQWALTRCETLLPFMCQIQACPKGSKHCSNGKCVNQKYVCDDQDDCGDGSDELDCQDRCRFHMNQLNSGQVKYFIRSKNGKLYDIRHRSKALEMVATMPSSQTANGRWKDLREPTLSWW